MTADRVDAPFWGPWGSRIHHACEAQGLPDFARMEPMRDDAGRVLPGMGSFCLVPPVACANEEPVSAFVEVHAREGLFARAAKFGMLPSEFLASTEVLHA